MISIVYSADIAFQVLAVLPTANSKTAWNFADKLAIDGKFKEIQVNHYDVVQFDNPTKMNDWILEQVELSRE